MEIIKTVCYFKWSRPANISTSFWGQKHTYVLFLFKDQLGKIINCNFDNGLIKKMPKILWFQPLQGCVYLWVFKLLFRQNELIIENTFRLWHLIHWLKTIMKIIISCRLICCSIFMSYKSTFTDHHSQCHNIFTSLSLSHTVQTHIQHIHTHNTLSTVNAGPVPLSVSAGGEEDKRRVHSNTWLLLPKY